MRPIINDINNAVLQSSHAMPAKDSTSDGTSTFAMGRRDFSKSLGIMSMQNPVPNVQKKWIGGNRDASQIIENRRNISIGSGSLNANGTPISFMTKRDPNTQRDALKRARSGGAAVPAKVTHKYPNPPVFY